MNDLLETFRNLTLQSDKETVHSYVSNLYAEVFERFKGKSPVIVEIGVWQGGSLEMAHNYFGHDALIIGLDIDLMQSAMDWARDKSNVLLIGGDAYDRRVAMDIPSFDIFIDDGPHTLSAQKAAIDLYLPKMKDAGVFIIEDIQSDRDAQALLNHVPDGYEASLKDFRMVKGRYDDLVLYVTKVQHDVC